MAIKIYYSPLREEGIDSDGYMVYVFDSPAWLYNDPKPRPMHLMVIDRGARELAEFPVENRKDLKAAARDAV